MAGVFAIHTSSLFPALVPAAAGHFGAGRLFALIIVVFLALMALFIVPLEVRLHRERRSAADRPSAHERE